jgi:hypothetical protein
MDFAAIFYMRKININKELFIMAKFVSLDAWRKQIGQLLNTHKFQLFDDDHMLLVIMNEAKTGKVSVQYCEVRNA